MATALLFCCSPALVQYGIRMHAAPGRRGGGPGGSGGQRPVRRHLRGRAARPPAGTSTERRSPAVTGSTVTSSRSGDRGTVTVTVEVVSVAALAGRADHLDRDRPGREVRPNDRARRVRHVLRSLRALVANAAPRPVETLIMATAAVALVLVVVAAGRYVDGSAQANDAAYAAARAASLQPGTSQALRRRAGRPRSKRSPSAARPARTCRSRSPAATSPRAARSSPRSRAR